jgi:abortive infection bacteriophage resistance protein
MILEIVSFGKIAHIYRNLALAERRRIARLLNIDERVLSSWALSLSYARNLCAHHERLWNRTFTLKPLISKQYQKEMTPNDTCYAQLVTMQVLMKTVSPSSRWHDRVKMLFQEHPNISPHLLGCPEDWQTRPVWR